MFSKRRFRRRNKPHSQNLLDGGEQQKESPFIPPIQTKLNIGKPGDVYEVEADKTADEVVNKTSAPNAVQKMGTEEEEVQAKPLAQGLTPFVQKQETEKEAVQKQAEEEEEPVQAQEEEEEVQAQPEEEEPVQAQEEEEEVQAQEEEEELQAQEEEEELQAKSDIGSKGALGLEENLKNTASQGLGLPKPTKKKMEAAFGADFSKVRIHTGGKADQMNKQLGARAFTHGSDIYFKAGNYNPDSMKGQHLLAHELTHTIQQGAIGAKQPGGEQVRNASSKIQMAKLRYDDRPLKWSDYTKKYEPGVDDKHSANSAINIFLSQKEDLVHGGWQQTGSNSYILTITYKPSSVEIFAIFTQEESSKEKWITDDEEARTKLGHDNIEQARADLLVHEQVHFHNAKIIAEKYDLMAKAAVPTDPYTETATAKNIEEIDSKLNDLRTRKGKELSNILSEIRRAGEEELKSIQELYDVDTKHGKEPEKQQNWQNDFEKAMEEAKKSANPEQGKEESNTDE